MTLFKLVKLKLKTDDGTCTCVDVRETRYFVEKKTNSTIHVDKGSVREKLKKW